MTTRLKNDRVVPSFTGVQYVPQDSDRETHRGIPSERVKALRIDLSFLCVVRHVFVLMFLSHLRLWHDESPTGIIDSKPSSNLPFLPPKLYPCPMRIPLSLGYPHPRRTFCDPSVSRQPSMDLHLPPSSILSPVFTPTLLGLLSEREKRQNESRFRRENESDIFVPNNHRKTQSSIIKTEVYYPFGNFSFSYKGQDHSAKKRWTNTEVIKLWIV